MSDRIFLSKPNVDNEESLMMTQVMESGWIAPVGPHLDLFENELEKLYEHKRVLCLNSGTSSLHLALKLAGVTKGDDVIVSTFTFIASANVVMYEGARPVLIDSEEDTWNMDPALLSQYLAKVKKKPKAIIVTHLYGNAAKIQAIIDIASEYSIPIIEDAAEALGTRYAGKSVGQFGQFGILSFNGNKIITTSGGGALITDEAGYKQGLHISTQANLGKQEYHHEELGYNYRLSNLLAGMGIVQLRKLEAFIRTKRSINDRYQETLSEYISFPKEEEHTESNKWLTVGLLKERVEPTDIINHLERFNIESRRLWKPMHLQPLFRESPVVNNGVSENLFKKGICLPSGTGLSNQDQEKVIQGIHAFFGD